MILRKSGWTTALSCALLAAAMFALSACSWFEGDAPPPPVPGQAPPPAAGEAPPAPELADVGIPDDDYDPEEPKPDKPPPLGDLRNDIVSVVNDQAITVYELEQRVGLTMSTTPIPNTPEMRQKVREQALEELETELIQRQEAQKNDITVSAPEVDESIAEIVKDNNIDLDQLKAALARDHVSIATLRARLANQLLWRKAVMMMFSGRVNIAPETVDAEMARMQASAGKVHYKVAEIFIAVDNPEQNEKAHKDIQGLYDQLKSGAPFQAMARQFSQSPTAKESGLIGDVYDGQLAPELNTALGKMKTGDISEPIRATGGYYILYLVQRFEPAGTKIEEDKPEDRALPPNLPLARLLLPLGAKPPKALIENAMKVADALHERVPNCKALEAISKNIQGSVYMNLGEVRLADLSPQIRAIMAQTEPGSVAKPFLSDAGVEIFGRCDKPVVKLQVYKMPTREQVEQAMFEEQISAMARRYTRDLRRQATIERREPGKKAELVKAPEPAKKPEPAAGKAP